MEENCNLKKEEMMLDCFDRKILRRIFGQRVLENRFNGEVDKLGAIHKLRHTNFMIFLPLPRPCHRWSHF